jgi:hypothetical protein
MLAPRQREMIRWHVALLIATSLLTCLVTTAVVGPA